jgi:hypothetical protein
MGKRDNDTRLKIPITKGRKKDREREKERNSDKK